MHALQRALALLGVLVVAAIAVVGGYAFVLNYAIAVADPTLRTPTAATLVLTGLVVFALFVLGARSDRWLENPYW